MERHLCKCGCGKETRIAERNRLNRGQIKGCPLTYIHGHNKTFPTPKVGPENGNWKGGRRVLNGYQAAYSLKHRRAHAKSNYVYEHILIAEHALGKELPKNAVIHHVDHNTLNNKNSNLVICQDQGYHLLLHVKERRMNHGRTEFASSQC
ncbi:MAG: HNH endonuclease [Syntrophus sp. (in: bacteria)]